ncbi:MAG: dTMP kinase [Acidobacteriota bacterium]|nr:dTMP kinase [Acidobacteriota bacterium]MCH8319717.1 dTMP kinase [Acidobacteriota bacterium]
MPGKFITLEGIEGSGKSVQLHLLEEELKKRKVHFLITQQPGGTPFGKEVRQILLQQEGAQREPTAELLLYLADRYQHLKEVIEPSLTQGLHVLCDRYHDATLAYQGHARGLGFPMVDQLAKILALRIPDLTLVLDLEVEVGLKRARERNQNENSENWGRFEAEDLYFHRRVREGYRLLVQREPNRVLLVDASGTPEEVFKKLLGLLEEREIID